MGLDGGTIISRSDVLRGASWRVASSGVQCRSTRGGQVGSAYVAAAERASAGDQAAVHWSTCALTGEPLVMPVVACGLGRLYNRENVVQYLLARSDVFVDDSAKVQGYVAIFPVTLTLPPNVCGVQWRYANQQQYKERFSHLRSLKDVWLVHQDPQLDAGVPLQVAQIDGSASSPCSQPSTLRAVPIWTCPITGVKAGGLQSVMLHVHIVKVPYCGMHRFSLLRRCGHCFSSRALRQVKDMTCSACGVAYVQEDIISLNNNEEEEAALMTELLAKRRKDRNFKVAKKRRLDE
eukprot:SM000056S18004  [mRNA]  locus=s56:652934:654974:+ [translate_table: standard]